MEDSMSIRIAGPMELCHVHNSCLKPQAVSMTQYTNKTSYIYEFDCGCQLHIFQRQDVMPPPMCVDPPLPFADDDPWLPATVHNTDVWTPWEAFQVLFLVTLLTILIVVLWGLF